VRRLLLAALIVALLPLAGWAGPLNSEDTLQRYFRLDWSSVSGARGPEIAGYIENVSDLPFDRMRLVIERLDGAGTVVGSSTTYVMGPIIPNHRTYFTTQVAAAPSYRVRILSFDWSNCRD
jgi:hypothetical protein